MSNQQQKKIIGGRDLINIGIFTAIIFIITMAVMPIGFIPVLMPLLSLFGIHFGEVVKL